MISPLKHDDAKRRQTAECRRIRTGMTKVVARYVFRLTISIHAPDFTPKLLPRRRRFTLPAKDVIGALFLPDAAYRFDFTI